MYVNVISIYFKLQIFQWSDYSSQQARRPVTIRDLVCMLLSFMLTIFREIVFELSEVYYAS